MRLWNHGYRQVTILPVTMPSKFTGPVAHKFCLLTDKAIIDNVMTCQQIKTVPFAEALADGRVEVVTNEIDEAFLEVTRRLWLCRSARSKDLVLAATRRGQRSGPSIAGTRTDSPMLRSMVLTQKRAVISPTFQDMFPTQRTMRSLKNQSSTLATTVSMLS